MKIVIHINEDRHQFVDTTHALDVIEMVLEEGCVFPDKIEVMTEEFLLG